MKRKELEALEGEDLKKAALELFDKLEEQNKAVTVLEKEVTGLSKKLSEAEKAGFVKLTVEVKKKEYEVLSGAKLEGVAYTAQDLAANPDVCAAILKIEGQNILAEVTQ